MTDRLDLVEIRAIVAALVRRCDAALAAAPGHGQDDPAEALVAEFRQRCADEGWLIDGGLVREMHAGPLVNRSPLTLRNRRYLDRPIPYTTDASGWVWYRLEDLARYRLEHGELAE